MTCEKSLFTKYIKENSVGAEIGVWKGDFTRNVSSFINVKKYYLIDPWECSVIYDNRWYSSNVTNSKNMDNIYNKICNEFNSEKYVILRGYSNDQMKNIKNDELDWIYIDGDHSENAVYDDLYNSLLKVKTNGFIICDDYIWDDPDSIDKKKNYYPVKAAIDRFLSENEKNVKLVEIISNRAIITIFKK